MDVLTVNDAPLAPAGMNTLLGTLAAPLLLDRVTCTPTAGAGALKLTVPVEGLPLTTLVGFRTIEERETLVVLLLGASSNSRMAGFGSFSEMPTNFEGEIM